MSWQELWFLFMCVSTMVCLGAIVCAGAFVLGRLIEKHAPWIKDALGFGEGRAWYENKED